MTTKIELNGDGIPKIVIRPGDNPIEGMALSQLLEASGKGTVVTLVSDGGQGVILSVKSSKAAAEESTSITLVDVGAFCRP